MCILAKSKTFMNICRKVELKLPKRNKPKKVQSTVSNESRRSKEDNMAAIFMGFIFVFLVCHLPRLLLNIHELATLQDSIDCQAAEKEPLSFLTLASLPCSHLLLVINSSTNIFIYSFMSSKFREECKKVYYSIFKKY